MGRAERPRSSPGFGASSAALSCVRACVWLQDLILFRTPDRHRWAAGNKSLTGE